MPPSTLAHLAAVAKAVQTIRTLTNEELTELEALTSSAYGRRLLGEAMENLRQSRKLRSRIKATGKEVATKLAGVALKGLRRVLS